MTIKGGLPVRVTGEIVRCNALEYPGHDYLEDVMVMFESGHEIKFDLSESDQEEVEKALWAEISIY